ncbi:hypothetical protein Tco_0424084 [Tanacetum coccineum]
MMHPERLRGQHRKKLCWLKVGLPFLKTARMVTRRKNKAFDVSNVMRMAQESGAGDEDYDLGVARDASHLVSSLFNTESREASINLNTNVGDNDEDEVQEVQQLEGRDKARAAGKRDKSVRIVKYQKEGGGMSWREIEQQDMRFYLQPYDHLTGDQRNAMEEIRAKIKAKYNLQY